MSFYVKTVREGLNLLFPVPVAKVSWPSHKGFAQYLKQNLADVEVGTVPANRTKLESSADLRQSSDPQLQGLFAFMVDRAADMSRALLRSELSEAWDTARRASRAAFREEDQPYDDEVSGSVILEISRAWMNVYEAGHFHGPHSHPGALLAAIYAVALPEGLEAPEGSVALQDPRREALNHLGPLRFTGEGIDAVCQLREGELLLFPGWLTHYVIPHRCPSRRITISANIGLRAAGAGDGHE